MCREGNAAQHPGGDKGKGGGEGPGVDGTEAGGVHMVPLAWRPSCRSRYRPTHTLSVRGRGRGDTSPRSANANGGRAASPAEWRWWCQRRWLAVAAVVPEMLVAHHNKYPHTAPIPPHDPPSQHCSPRQQRESRSGGGGARDVDREPITIKIHTQPRPPTPVHLPNGWNGSGAVAMVYT